MNPLNVIRGFDPDLYNYFEQALEQQRLSLSFIPDENCSSLLSAAIMGSVLVNTSQTNNYLASEGLEKLAAKRICELFKAEHANVRALTIEAASRVVFQALIKRGDVVMSLDLRKKEHCNSESYVYRFVNFSVDKETNALNYDAIEKQALECKPKLIIVSPINYPFSIDYERFAKIAKACGAYLWCDISQIAGLVATNVMSSPVPYADVVTFTAHGAMQGPQAAVILSTDELAGVIDRTVFAFGHSGLQSASLGALTARVSEMAHSSYESYCKAVLKNAKALANGLKKANVSVFGDNGESHLILVDARSIALSARGAQEILSEIGIKVRICTLQTSDPNGKYDAVRFSTLASTTRGVTESQLGDIGYSIGEFLKNPSDTRKDELKMKIAFATASLPVYFDGWLAPLVKENLSRLNFISNSDSTLIHDDKHKTRLSKIASRIKMNS